MGNIVQDTKSCAYIKFEEEDSKHQSYRELDGSWRDTTPEEILRLIAPLIYFGLVKVVR